MVSEILSKQVLCTTYVIHFLSKDQILPPIIWIGAHQSKYVLACSSAWFHLKKKKVAVGQRRIAKRNACGELNSAEFDKKASLVISRALKMEKNCNSKCTYN